MVVDDLLERFLPRFRTLAMERLVKATAVATERDFPGIAGAAGDLHAIAGESGLLGLSQIAAAARVAEDLGRACGVSHAVADVEAFLAAVTTITSLIEALPTPRKETR